MTGFKNIVATLYLKNGQAVKSASDMTVMGDVYNLCQLYNDSGIDKIIIFDLSTDDDEHEKNIHTIENINRNIDIKVCAGGNINRIEDVKKLLYAGCLQVIFNATKDSSLELANVASEKFGIIQFMLPEVIHGCGSFSNTGEDYFICAHQRFLIGSNDSFYPQTL